MSDYNILDTAGFYTMAALDLPTAEVHDDILQVLIDEIRLSLAARVPQLGNAPA
jgi:hypothetical protein